MSIPRKIDRRREPRILTDMPLFVWSIETKCDRFLQEARARDISLSGALVTGLDVDLRSGDVIGISYQGNSARFRVVWIRYDAAGDKMQVAVHRVEPDSCPWGHLLPAEETAQAAGGASAEEIGY